MCVFAFEWLGHKGKQFFGKSVVSEGFEGLKPYKENFLSRLELSLYINDDVIKERQDCVT